MPPEDPDLVERAPPPPTPPPVKAQQAQLELCVRTKATLVPIPEPRSSVNSSSDTGAPGSTDSWGGTDFGGQSFTSPSLKQQVRARVVRASCVLVHVHERGQATLWLGKCGLPSPWLGGVGARA